MLCIAEAGAVLVTAAFAMRQGNSVADAVGWAVAALLAGGLLILAASWMFAPFRLTKKDRRRIVDLESEVANLIAVAQASESKEAIFRRIGHIKGMMSAAMEEYISINEAGGDVASRRTVWVGKVSGLLAFALHENKRAELLPYIEALNAGAIIQGVRPRALHNFQMAIIHIYPKDVDLSVPASAFERPWSEWGP